jgi:hypothetical protein
MLQKVVVRPRPEGRMEAQNLKSPESLKQCSQSEVNPWHYRQTSRAKVQVESTGRVKRNFQETKAASRKYARGESRVAQKKSAARPSVPEERSETESHDKNAARPSIAEGLRQVEYRDGLGDHTIFVLFRRSCKHGKSAHPIR